MSEIDWFLGCIQRSIILEELFSCLTPRQSKVVKMRYGYDSAKLTLKEISDEMKISTERVRQIEVKALWKMRLVAIKKGIEWP